MNRARKLPIAAAAIVLVALIVVWSRSMSESVAPAASADRSIADQRDDATAPAPQLADVEPSEKVASSDARAEVASNEVVAGPIDVHGRVVDELARPIEIFALHAIHRDANNWLVEQRDWPSEVHAQGEFDLMGLAPGRWEISTRAIGLTLERSHQFNTTRDVRVDFVMQGLGSISGFVLDPSGQPVIDAQLFVDGKPTSTRTNALGMFELQVDAGGHRLQARAAGFAPSDELPVSVGTRDQIDGVELTLPVGATLRGTVIDEMKQPVAGRQIVCFSLSRSVSTTDADGRFEFADIRPGRVKVYVYTPPAELERSIGGVLFLDASTEIPDHFVAHFTSVELHAGEVKTIALRFAPERPVRVVGHVWSATLESRTGCVFLVPSGEQMAKRDGSPFLALIDPSGGFELILPTFGRFFVTTNTDGQDRNTRDVGVVDIPDQDVFELKLEL